MDQPYMYDWDQRDSRFPHKEFDPKAVTRASYEVQPRPPPRKPGPLVSINRHPDAHVVLTGRTQAFQPMSDLAKWLIKWTRYIQIVLRALELIVSAGLLVLMILISDVPSLLAWVLRIASGIIVLSSGYAIIHLSRPARARPPGSSAAYQLFAGLTDVGVIPFYSLGVVAALRNSGSWSTILHDSSSLPLLIKFEYSGLFAAIGLHAISLGISIYLGVMFKRIADMPPDMNPLESNLTSRRHKRNKSSVASGYNSRPESEKRLSRPNGGPRSSGSTYEDSARPRSIPFMQTRSRSRAPSSKRDSRGELPSRQYQTPGSSPRDSANFPADVKRRSNLRAQAGGYTEVPRQETNHPSFSVPGSTVADSQPTDGSPRRVAKFTEAWDASESLINRTQKRQCAMNANEPVVAQRTKAYEALNQRYGDDDSESDRENHMQPDDDISDLEDYDHPNNGGDDMRPDPLRLNTFRPKTRYSQPVYTGLNTNWRDENGSEDIADAPGPARRQTVLEAWGRGSKGIRNFSIQRDDQFSSKPYGELRSGTPPIMYGGESNGNRNRQVSSGNDYDLGNTANLGFRRNASGRAAEEGMAGPPSRYDALDE